MPAYSVDSNIPNSSLNGQIPPKSVKTTNGVDHTIMSLREILFLNLPRITHLYSGDTLSRLPIAWVIKSGAFYNLCDHRLSDAIQILSNWGKKLDKENYYPSQLCPKSAPYLYRQAELRGDKNAMKALTLWGFSPTPIDARDVARFGDIPVEKMLVKHLKKETGPYPRGEYTKTYWRLLNYGVDPSTNIETGDIRGYKWVHPLYALSLSSSDEVQTLIEHGIEISGQTVADCIVRLLWIAKLPNPQLDEDKRNQMQTRGTPWETITDTVKCIDMILKHAGKSITAQDSSGNNVMHHLIYRMKSQSQRGSRRAAQKPVQLLALLSRLDPSGELLRQKNDQSLTPHDLMIKLFGKNYLSYTREKKEHYRTVLTTPYFVIDPTEIQDLLMIERAFNWDKYSPTPISIDYDDFYDY